jgi:ethanolamine kinase
MHPLTSLCLTVVLRWVNSFAVMAHAFWGTWALIQAKYSPIDFDFLQYGSDRFGGYRLHKGRFLPEAPSV